MSSDAEQIWRLSAQVNFLNEIVYTILLNRFVDYADADVEQYGESVLDKFRFKVEAPEGTTSEQADDLIAMTQEVVGFGERFFERLNADVERERERRQRQ